MLYAWYFKIKLKKKRLNHSETKSISCFGHSAFFSMIILLEEASGTDGQTCASVQQRGWVVCTRVFSLSSSKEKVFNQDCLRTTRTQRREPVSIAFQGLQYNIFRPKVWDGSMSVDKDIRTVWKSYYFSTMLVAREERKWKRRKRKTTKVWYGEVTQTQNQTSWS